ncbi:hypothetical protein AURDEDRAFT_55167, partial [Auricularia subglabra TFB-10046 SS5]
SLYLGIDPTARSLHVGHLIPLLCLLHFRQSGHNSIALVGGATGQVGDPSFRTNARDAMSSQVLHDNIAALDNQLHTFFRRAAPKLSSFGPAEGQLNVLNNASWHGDLRLMDFLARAGSAGPHSSFRIPHRADAPVCSMTSRAEGLNYREFTYQLLQAYDFQHLYTAHDCVLQIGGADQWGNIITGLDLIRRNAEGAAAVPEVFGLTTVLLTTSSGDKFGKSAGNAVWLDESLTSVFDFYQFWLRTTDEDVEKHLKLFTFLSMDRISDVMDQHHTRGESSRIAQRVLADEMTDLIHGPEALAGARMVTQLFFENDVAALDAAAVLRVLAGNPRLCMLDAQDAAGATVASLAAKSQLVASNSAAKQLVGLGGLYLNGQKVQSVQQRVAQEDFIDGRLLVLRAGKDKHMVVALR